MFVLVIGNCELMTDIDEGFWFAFGCSRQTIFNHLYCFLNFLSVPRSKRLIDNQLFFCLCFVTFSLCTGVWILMYSSELFFFFSFSCPSIWYLYVLHTLFFARFNILEGMTFDLFIAFLFSYFFFAQFPYFIYSLCFYFRFLPSFVLLLLSYPCILNYKGEWNMLKQKSKAQYL